MVLMKIHETWKHGGILDTRSKFVEYACAAAAYGLATIGLLEWPDVEIDTALATCLVSNAHAPRYCEYVAQPDYDRSPAAELALRRSFLQECGWDEAVVDAACLTGHTGLSRFFHAYNVVKPHEKIAHLTYAVTHGTTYPPLDERMALLRQVFSKLQQGDPRTYGLPKWRTIIGVQEEIAFRILAEFGDRVGRQPLTFHQHCSTRAQAILMS